MPIPSLSKAAGAEATLAGKLTRSNLQAFTAAKRQEDAHRKGRSTPSPEPDLHALKSEDSYESGCDIPPDVLAYSKAMMSYIPASGPIPGLKRVTPWWSRYSDVEDDLSIAKGEASNMDRESERNKSDRPLNQGSEQEAPVNHQDAHDSIQHWDDLRAQSPAADDIDDYIYSHDARTPLDAHPEPNHGRQPAHPDILYKRPSIPRRQPASESATADPQSQFPPEFPAYHCTQNMNEIAAYLANASYVASLGDLPLADLKYGIIIVPAGEEKLLFGRQPNFVMTQEFLDAVDDANRDYDRALRMHDPDEDSAEFVRKRFDQDFPSVEGEAHRGAEVGLGREDGDGEEGDGGEGDGDRHEVVQV